MGGKLGGRTACDPTPEVGAALGKRHELDHPEAVKGGSGREALSRRFGGRRGPRARP
jgi:hypothetical protein